jgi:uncharacterized membrane protein YecN with MAPEG domain
VLADLLPLLATLAALWVYVWTFILCGHTRRKHGIKAPATAGHPEFDRAFRIQQNTLEQLILFLPSLWLFCQVVSGFWGGAIGLVWSLGRILYGIGYLRAPEARGPGFAIGMAATAILLVGGTLGVLYRLA